MSEKFFVFKCPWCGDLGDIKFMIGTLIILIECQSCNFVGKPSIFEEDVEIINDGILN